MLQNTYKAISAVQMIHSVHSKTRNQKIFNLWIPFFMQLRSIIKPIILIFNDMQFLDLKKTPT